jgi:hypothetical protein
MAVNRKRALPSVEHFVSSHTDSRLHKYSRILYLAPPSSLAILA